MAVTTWGGFNATNQALYGRFGRQEHERIKREFRAKLDTSRLAKEALTDSAEILAYQINIRQKIKNALGGAPVVGPLNVITTNVLYFSNYRIESLVFESLPGWLVSANLYLPTNATNPVPGVVGLCGHLSTGKAGYQEFPQALAKLGIACLMIDSYGQGERNEYSQAPGSEHIQSGRQLPLVGWSMAGLMVHDATRAIDLLLSRSDINSEHIGITGNSGGGTVAMLTAAYDERITMAAPSCWGTSWQRMIESEIGGMDHEQMPPELVGLNLDIADLMIAYAPRPLVIIAQKRDFFDVRGVYDVHAATAAIYQILGSSENLRLHAGPGDHGFNKDGREAMYSMFNFATTGNSASIVEPSGYAPLTETQLFAAGGDVYVYGSKRLETVMDEMSLAQKMNRGSPTGTELQQRIESVLCFPTINRNEPPDYAIQEHASYWSYHGNYVNGPLTTPQQVQIKAILDAALPQPDATNLLNSIVTKLKSGLAVKPCYPKGYGCTYLVETEPDVVAPLYYFHANNQLWHSEIPQSGPSATLFVPHLSADQEVAQNSREPLVVQLMAAEPNKPLFAMDVRISGESYPVFNGTYYDDCYSGRVGLLGQTMLGRKVWDILRCLDLLTSYGFTQVHLVGVGWGAVPTALAAVLHNSVTQITLKNALTRWEACVRAKPDQMAVLASMLPRGALAQFDLPDIYAELQAKNLVSTIPWGAWLANPNGEF